ncbi:MAG: phospholipase D-like domain-containing protein [Acidobacteriota bacterium]
MIHAKIMTVDNVWSVAGSTNFDHRSFALNDEVNIAIMDRELAAQLNGDFADDLIGSIRRSVATLEKRSLSVRAIGALGNLLRREE